MSYLSYLIDFILLVFWWHKNMMAKRVLLCSIESKTVANSWQHLCVSIIITTNASSTISVINALLQYNLHYYRRACFLLPMFYRCINACERGIHLMMMSMHTHALTNMCGMFIALFNVNQENNGCEEWLKWRKKIHQYNVYIK